MQNAKAQQLKYVNKYIILLVFTIFILRRGKQNISINFYKKMSDLLL